MVRIVIPRCDNPERCVFALVSRDFRRFHGKYSYDLNLLKEDKKSPHFIGIPQQELESNYPFTWEELRFYILTQDKEYPSYFNNKHVFPDKKTIYQHLPEMIQDLEENRDKLIHLFEELSYLHKKHIPYGDGGKYHYTRHYQKNFSLEKIGRKKRFLDMFYIFENPNLTLEFVEANFRCLEWNRSKLASWSKITIDMVLKNKFYLQTYMPWVTINLSISPEDILAHPQLDWNYTSIFTREDVLPHMFPDHLIKNRFYLMEGLSYNYIKQHPEFDYTMFFSRTVATKMQIKLTRKFLNPRWKLKKMIEIDY